MKPQKEIDELLARHLAGEPLSEEQQRQVNEWIQANQNTYQRMCLLMKDTEQEMRYPDFDASQAWQRIEPRLKPHTRLSLSIGLRKVIGYSVAASITILLLLGILQLQWKESGKAETLHYANNSHMVKNINLPDGSTVALYPDATLTYQAEKDRTLQLTGKAFFSVSRNGQRFRVGTPEFQVEVLGTSFLICSGNSDQKGVFVKTGKVQVGTSRQQVVIQAGEQVQLEGNSLRSKPIEKSARLFDHTEPLLFFDRTPLKEAVREIERQTGIRIELGEGLEHNSLTTRINLNNRKSIAAELSFVCGCHCDTLETEKHYRLYDK